MRFEAAVFDSAHERFDDRSLLQREERDTRTFDGRIAHLHDLAIGQIGNQADTPRRVLLQVPSEAAREVERIDGIKRDAEAAEDDVQAGDVGARDEQQHAHGAGQDDDLRAASADEGKFAAA